MANRRRAITNPLVIVGAFHPMMAINQPGTFKVLHPQIGWRRRPSNDEQSTGNSIEKVADDIPRCPRRENPNIRFHHAPTICEDLAEMSQKGIGPPDGAAS